MDPNACSHMPVPVVNCELCAVQCSAVENVLCAVQFVCRFYRVLAGRKRKCKFTDEVERNVAAGGN